jgi:hypothetical protein
VGAGLGLLLGAEVALGAGLGLGLGVVGAGDGLPLAAGLLAAAVAEAGCLARLLGRGRAACDAASEAAADGSTNCCWVWGRRRAPVTVMSVPAGTLPTGETERTRPGGTAELMAQRTETARPSLRS